MNQFQIFTRLSFFFILCFLQVKAQNIPPKLLIEKSKKENLTFQQIDKVFNIISKQKKLEIEKKIPEELSCFQLLKIDQQKINNDLYSKNKKNVSFKIPFEEENIELELVEVNLFTPNYVNNVMPVNKVEQPQNKGKHFWGTVKGDPNSIASISIFENEVMGMISSSNKGNLVLGKLKNDSNYILYEDKELKEVNTFSCHTSNEDINKAQKEENNQGNYKAAAECIGVHYDIGRDIINDKGGTDGALEFIYGIFSQVAMIYANENISVKIESTTIWTNNEPFKYSSDVGLPAYRDYRTNNSWSGSVSHYVHYNGGGGMAYLNALCSGYYGYGTNGISSFYSNVPTYSWTVYVMAHELGHNFGSPHTQSCSWEGGPLDNCVGVEDGNCSPGPTPTNGGTVMSYCHLTNVGINYYEGFGQQPGDLIRYYYNNASCKFECDGDQPPTANCNDGIQNQGETGIDCGGPCSACPCNNGTNVTVSINLDNYPAETSWSIVNDNGQTIKSGDNYTNANSTVNTTICMSDGCYTFVINDAYGDGLCCQYGNGSYSVTANGQTLVSGASFTSSESKQFCLNDTPPSNESCNDGIQNQGETGIDCGGPCAPCQEPCNLNLVCEYRVNATGGWNGGDCSAEVCVGDELVISVNPNGLPSYDWTGPNGFSGKGAGGGDILVSSNINNTHAGTYTVVATDNNGCEATKSITVTVNGCIADADNDGVPDSQDQCPGQNDNIIGNSCNDGNACTTNDKYDNNCNCIGQFQDADGDGVCDTYDICNGGNDNLDSDSDGIPDACDESTNVTEGCYFFKFKHSNKYLSVTEGAGKKGSNVEQSSYFGGNDEKFIVIKANNNDGYYIYSHTSENGLEVQSSGEANGANIGIWKINLNANHHRWYFEDVENGYYKLQNKNSGKYLDVSGVSTAQGANVHQWSSTNGDNQRFQLISCSTPPPVVINDSDNDGVPDNQDKCPGQNDNIIGNSCNDGDPCTINDKYDNNCDCIGTFQDSDNDGICNVYDECPGFNDMIDNNNNGTPDGCECDFNLNLDNVTACFGDLVTLYGPNGYDSYLWSNGAVTQNIIPGQTGSYTLTVTDENGCEGTGNIVYSLEQCDGISFDIGIRLHLEGFMLASGKMTTFLNENGLIPYSSPFSATPHFYSGTEQSNSMLSTIVDWILIKIHNENGDIIAEKVALLNNNGFVKTTDGESSINFTIPYGEIQSYMSVYHKSHLPVVASIEGKSYIDFTSEVTLGLNQTTEVYGKEALIVGDFDSNGIINNVDYNIWKSDNALINQYLNQDADGNGIINNLDFNMWDKNKSRVGHPMVQD